jgi:hypothetical protein
MNVGSNLSVGGFVTTTRPFKYKIVVFTSVFTAPTVKNLRPFYIAQNSDPGQNSFIQLPDAADDGGAVGVEMDGFEIIFINNNPTPQKFQIISVFQGFNGVPVSSPATSEFNLLNQYDRVRMIYSNDIQSWFTF